VGCALTTANTRLSGPSDVTSLDGLITYTLEATATSSFPLHSLLATLNVLRTVVCAAGSLLS
jgi:hypothetical protein